MRWSQYFYLAILFFQCFGCHQEKWQERPGVWYYQNPLGKRIIQSEIDAYGSSLIDGLGGLQQRVSRLVFGAYIHTRTYTYVHVWTLLTVCYSYDICQKCRRLQDFLSYHQTGFLSVYMVVYLIFSKRCSAVRR